MMSSLYTRIKAVGLFLLLSLCQIYSQLSVTEFDVKKLSIEEVKSSGKELISQPFGFIKIVGTSPDSFNVLIVAVHGYRSEGYEWIAAIKKLAKRYDNTYFYRYDWEICPEKVGDELATQISELLKSLPSIKRVVLFGHSYGGLVVTYSAPELELSVPVEIHTIAAPLAGYPKIFDKCDIKKNKDTNILYPSWGSFIHHFQWRTVHKQDNAFNKLLYDPQVVMLSDSKVYRLPETMDGHRLGHNWSISWVIDEYLGIPHNP